MNKKANTVNGFIGTVNESKCKPEKLWVDQGNFAITLSENG